MRRLVHLKSLAIAAVLGVGLVAPTAAHADALLMNGGFEAALSGWTVANQAGGDGTFYVQSGPFSPINLFDVPPPPEGFSAAMTDSEGPGSHLLYQDFLVPLSLTQASLSFSLFVSNGAENYSTPATLDFSTPILNQQARVDLMLASEGPFSPNVLLNVFKINVGDPLVSGYSTYGNPDITALLTAHAGQTLRLRFAEVDNVNFFNLGVDDVSLEADANATPVPEPGTLLLFATGLAALRARRRHR